MSSEAAWQADVRLDPLPASAGRARAFVTTQLHQRELGYLVDDVRLVVSELVTNAVVHARTPVRVLLEELMFCVKLRVYDESVTLPVMRIPSGTNGDDEDGRGLWITDACSVDWGIDHGNIDGKSVWALFALRPTSSWLVRGHG